MKRVEIRPIRDTIRAGAISTIILLLCLPATMQAQEVLQPPTGLHIVSPESAASIKSNSVQPHAIRLHAAAVSVVGACSCSVDGVTFTNFGRGQVFAEGALIRTGNEGRTDLLFQRSGTTVRLQAGTEIKLESISVTLKDRHPSEHALLNLRKGKMFTVVPSTATSNTLEIRTAAGRSVMEGSGGGRYIITADGADVSAIDSITPIKLIGENGIAIIAAGQQFNKQEGKVLPLSPSLYVKDLVQLNELQASPNGSAAGHPALP